MGKLYIESYNEKFKSLNNEKISSKDWHNKLQRMCNYKKNKELLDTLNGPITPHAKLNTTEERVSVREAERVNEVAQYDAKKRFSSSPKTREQREQQRAATSNRSRSRSR